MGRGSKVNGFPGCSAGGSILNHIFLGALYERPYGQQVGARDLSNTSKMSMPRARHVWVMLRGVPRLPHYIHGSHHFAVFVLQDVAMPNELVTLPRNHWCSLRQVELHSQRGHRVRIGLDGVFVGILFFGRRGEPTSDAFLRRINFC